MLSGFINGYVYAWLGTSIVPRISKFSSSALFLVLLIACIFQGWYNLNKELPNIFITAQTIQVAVVVATALIYILKFSKVGFYDLLYAWMGFWQRLFESEKIDKYLPGAKKYYWAKIAYLMIPMILIVILSWYLFFKLIMFLIFSGGDFNKKVELMDKLSNNETIPVCSNSENILPCEFDAMGRFALSRFVDDFRPECRYFRLSPPDEEGAFNIINICPEEIKEMGIE